MPVAGQAVEAWTEYLGDFGVWHLLDHVRYVVRILVVLGRALMWPMNWPRMAPFRDAFGQQYQSTQTSHS